MGDVVRVGRAGFAVALLVVGAVACSGGSDDGSSADAGGADEGAGEGDGGDAEQVEARPLSAAVEAWWDYDRPAEFGAVTTPVQVTVTDGTRLGCSLVRPAVDGAPAPGRHPGLVVELTPYAALRGGFEGEAAWFAERGYDGLVCNLRGTGASEGTWQHAMSPQDGRDAADLVEWLAAQPHSDGRIGQFGESYGGQTSYGAAVEAPPHLRAVAPLQPPGNLYDDVIYPGGIKATEGGPIDYWPGIAQGLSGGRIDPAAEYAVGREHPTFDGYWQERAFSGRYDDIEVPVLTIGGWLDGFFRSGTLTNIEGALDRTWAIYGPWPHLAPVAFPGCTACNADGLPPGVLLAWFDRWVMELDDVPVPDEPVFVSHEMPDGGWRELSHWDPDGTGAEVLPLGPDGTLASPDADAPGNGPGDDTSDDDGAGDEADNETGDEPGDDADSGAGGGASFRQPAEVGADGGSVTFTTEPLGDDAVLLGRAVLDLTATLDGPDANLHVELLDVAPDGTEARVNDGYLRVSHRESHEDPAPVTPGEPTGLTVEVWPAHHRFVAGHRIAVRVSGGSPAALVPNPTPVVVTIDVAASSLSFPSPVEP